MMKRAVLYARVAAGNERFGQRLLAEQLATCREYAEEHGLEVVAELAEDKGGASVSSKWPGLVSSTWAKTCMLLLGKRRADGIWLCSFCENKGTRRSL